jgi:hypothetical protein
MQSLGVLSPTCASRAQGLISRSGYFPHPAGRKPPPARQGLSPAGVGAHTEKFAQKSCGARPPPRRGGGPNLESRPNAAPSSPFPSASPNAPRACGAWSPGRGCLAHRVGVPQSMGAPGPAVWTPGRRKGRHVASPGIGLRNFDNFAPLCPSRSAARDRGNRWQPHVWSVPGGCPEVPGPGRPATRKEGWKFHPFGPRKGHARHRAFYSFTPVASETIGN